MTNSEADKPKEVPLSAEDIEALQERLTQEFKDRGLFTKVFDDEPNDHSEPHAHEGATIATLAGSAKVRLDGGEWQEVVPGTITTIADDQLHEVVTGPDGWRYLFACSQQEARRQGLTE